MSVLVRLENCSNEILKVANRYASIHGVQISHAAVDKPSFVFSGEQEADRGIAFEKALLARGAKTSLVAFG